MYVTKDEAVVVGAVVTSAIVVADSAAVVVDVDVNGAADDAVDTAGAVVDAGFAAALSDTCSQHNSNTKLTPSQQCASPPAP